LTPQQAWAKYERLEGWKVTIIPTRVKVHIGLLTLPVGRSHKGTMLYTAKNELAYGYSVHSCPKSRNPKVRSLPANPCVAWTFLDANTGRQIDSTWQM
jgi:hypothetical protein